MRRLPGIGLLLALGAPALALAQFGGVSTPFTLSISPSNPAPYGVVTVMPVSSGVQVANSTMTVSVNGRQIASGNAGPVDVTLGGPGTKTYIVFTLKSGGASYPESLSIVPQDIALVAEPFSSAPPLYPGKPLVPQNGSVRLVAVADFRTASGKRLDPGTLSYQWSADGIDIPGASGIGRSAAIVDSPLQYRTRTVSVAVTSPDGSLTSGASMDIAASDPVVRVYERDPLLGIRFERALGSSYALPGAEATLYAGAYSFPTALGAPSIQWFLNGTAAQIGSLITLRPTGSGGGTATLSVTGSSGGSVDANTALSISFGSSGVPGFFGL